MKDKNKNKGKVSETYMIYIVQAYEFETDKGRLKNSALIELIDTSAENAIERTKKIISKKFYRISNVIEKQI